MGDFLKDIEHEFRRHKALVDLALSPLSDVDFFRRPTTTVNPIALILKHLAGNLLSRWTDFLATDGEKPTRDRDAEFVVTEDDTRAHLLATWERAWETLFTTLAGLSDSDLHRTVTIRGEPHSVRQALLRGTTHVAYHAGQILYLARWLRPENPWLTIAPGQSQRPIADYRSHPGKDDARRLPPASSTEDRLK